jgi:hypothetical protein
MADDSGRRRRHGLPGGNPATWLEARDEFKKIFFRSQKLMKNIPGLTGKCRLALLAL